MSDFEHYEPRPGVLSLSGEMTVATAAEIKDILLRALASHPKREIDLLNVTRLDTAGVQLLLLLQREALRHGKQLGWLGFSLAVDEVMELLDLADVLAHPAAVVWS